jgi:O-antigen/teichoic acid export membrane protein
MSHDQQQLLRRNARDVFLGSVSLQLARIIYIFVVARLLGVDAYGVLTYAHFIPLMILPILHSGLGPIVSRDLAVKKAGVEHQTSVAFTILTFAGLALSALLALLAVVFHPEIAGLVLLFSLGLVAQNTANWARSVADEPGRLAVRRASGRCRSSDDRGRGPMPGARRRRRHDPLRCCR